jgi:hypothetical protein
VEGLLLAGLEFRHTTLALNLGGFVDPFPDATSSRPIALESGIALEQVLDTAERYSLAGELAGVVYASGDPAQLQVAFGPTFAATPWLDLSLTSNVGFLRGSDRYGLMFGFAPHLPLWHPS